MAGETLGDSGRLWHAPTLAQLLAGQLVHAFGDVGS